MKRSHSSTVRSRAGRVGNPSCCDADDLCGDRRVANPSCARRSVGRPAPGVDAVRGGMVLVEATIVLGVFLLFIFAVCDLGLAVLRQNSLAEAARRLAREATVHGARATPQRTEWGPDVYEGTAADTNDYAAVVRPVLVTVDPADVSLRLRWPDGGNRSGERVEVRLTYRHHPIAPTLLGYGRITLRGEAAMWIEH